MEVKVENLSCKRGLRQVLKDVTFTVPTGGCLILRGPNGIGKSTLLRVLAGLNDAQSGTHNLDPDDIAFSGHLDAIKLQLTVAENLAFWAGVYDVETHQSVMAQFDLETFADRAAATLSAGQKRRLGLARMNLSKRRIWLMDEPTTSLDVAHTSLISQSISTHCANGGIAILSTHQELDIPNAKTLDLSCFVPKDVQFPSPFLEGSY